MNRPCQKLPSGRSSIFSQAYHRKRVKYLAMGLHENDGERQILTFNHRLRNRICHPRWDKKDVSIQICHTIDEVTHFKYNFNMALTIFPVRV